MEVAWDSGLAALVDPDTLEWEEEDMSTLGQTWHLLAACSGHDPELWFPTGDPGSDGYRRQAEDARAVCDDCPVSAECLDDALRAGATDGVWGGLDPDQRRALPLTVVHRAA